MENNYQRFLKFLLTEDYTLSGTLRNTRGTYKENNSLWWCGDLFEKVITWNMKVLSAELT